MYCSKQQNDWALLLSIVEFVYRQAIYITINYSSFITIYEYNSILKLCLENEIVEEKILVAKKRVKEINLIR